MDPQGEDSKWKDDFYISKFLEILLKFKDERNKRDEDFTESERRLPEYFHEFQEGLTAYDIKLVMRKIRELYKKEALKLIKSGKRQNESKLPWFSMAESLFSHTVNWEKEIEREQNIKSSSGSLARRRDGILSNIQREEEQLSPLPPTHMLFSPENVIVTTMFATTSVLPTITSSSTGAAKPFLVANSKLPFSSSSSDLTAAKYLVSLLNKRKKNAKFLTIDSPFVMHTNSSRIDHPFSPPTSPASRIPLRLTTTSFNSSLISNTVFTSTESRPPPVFISAANLPLTTVSLTDSSSTSLSWAEFPLSRTVTSCSYRAPCSTTVSYSLDKDPIFTTTVSPRVPFPLTPYRSEVPLLQVVSSPRSWIPIPKTTLCSNTNILTIDSPSSNAENLCENKPLPPYRTNVHLPSVAISKSNDLASAASSSRERVLKTIVPSSTKGQDILAFKPHLIYRKRDPLSSTNPSWFKASSFQNSSSSRAGALTSTSPASNTNDLTSATVSSSANAFRTSRSSVLGSSPSSSRDNVPEPTASSRPSVLTSAFSSSRDEILKTTAPSSSEGLHILPCKPYLGYKQRTSLTSTIAPSWFRVPFPQNSSSKSVVFTSTASPSRDCALTSTVLSSNTSGLTLSPSANAFRSPSCNPMSTASYSQDGVLKTTDSSSSQRLHILPYKHHLAYGQKTPLSSTVSPSWFRVSPFQNSSSKAGGLASTAPASNTSDLTSATVSSRANAFRSSKSCVLTPPLSSRDNVPVPTASSRPSVLTSAFSSSRDEILKTTAPSSSEGLHILPCKPYLGYKQRASLTSTIAPSWFRVPFPQNSSSKSVVFTSTASPSRDNVLTSTVLSSNTSDLTLSRSANAFRSSTPSSSTKVSFPQTASTSVIGISLSPIIPPYRNPPSYNVSTSRSESLSLSTASSSSRITRSMNTSHSNVDASYTISTAKTSLPILKREN